MKKPVVDYREFRLSKLNDPRFSHLKLLGGWIFYFVFYFLTENLIPFHEAFVIPYCFWYFLVGGSLLYFALYDVDSFKKLQVFIIITQVVAMAAYILYPSRQELRPEVFPRQNVLSALMGFIYAFDTPTGICPSLHVAYSLGIASVFCHIREESRAWKGFMVFSAVAISLSTAFVKQHSVVDIFAALPVCLLAEYLVFGRTKLNRWIDNGDSGV